MNGGGVLSVQTIPKDFPMARALFFLVKGHY